jgi:hypothetical protein
LTHPPDERPTPTGPGGDAATDRESRRAFLARVARGVTYSAPVIYTFAAPPAATAQTSGPPMMMTLCDYFPILCRWLGGNETSTFTIDPSTTPPGQTPSIELPTAPWSAPPPWDSGM